MSFTVSNAKRVSKGSLRGFFDLEMPSGLTIRGAMLFEKDGRRWIGLPSREWIKPDGTKAYQPIVEIPDREARDKFNAAVLPLAERALS
jgi:hypothetical protein